MVLCKLQLFSLSLKFLICKTGLITLQPPGELREFKEIMKTCKALTQAGAWHLASAQ